MKCYLYCYFDKYYVYRFNKKKEKIHRKISYFFLCHRNFSNFFKEIYQDVIMKYIIDENNKIFL